MIFDILTYIILIGASVALIWRMLLFFNVIRRKNTHSKCSGCSGGCDVQNVKFPTKELMKSYDKYRIRL